VLHNQAVSEERVLKEELEAAVPLFAIAAIFTGLPGVIAVCVALAVIAIVSSR
jgi:hypothetical protein